MVDAGFTTNVSMQQLQTLLSDTAPPAEAVAAVSGAGGAASRDDHKHPRLTSASVYALDASGECVIVFTRAFAAMPAVTCLLVEVADSQPIIFKVKTWATSGPNYTGCTIKGYRSSILPSLTGIILIGPLISSLSNLNVFGGSAAGAQFCCIALVASA